MIYLIIGLCLVSHLCSLLDSVCSDYHLLLLICYNSILYYFHLVFVASILLFYLYFLIIVSPIILHFSLLLVFWLVPYLYLNNLDLLVLCLSMLLVSVDFYTPLPNLPHHNITPADFHTDPIHSVSKTDSTHTVGIRWQSRPNTATR